MPTPSPIIVARVGATVPMVISDASTRSRPSPVSTPATAVRIGRRAA
jgi:hypothetical protein